MGAGDCARRLVWVLHPRVARLPHVHGASARSAARRRHAGPDPLHRARHPEGQQVFLHNGLMEYGSAFGHGAYLGPDYTADYLRRSADLVKRSYGGAASDSAGRKTIEDFRTNRYDDQT